MAQLARHVITKRAVGSAPKSTKMLAHKQQPTVARTKSGGVRIHVTDFPQNFVQGYEYTLILPEEDVWRVIREFNSGRTN